MPHPRPSSRPRPRRNAALLLIMLLAALFASSAAAQDSQTLADRWLRVQQSPYFGRVPLFSGDVASVTLMVGAEGKESEIRTWNFDERGWPLSTETALNPGPSALEFVSTWSYGADGLLNRIEIGGRSSFVWFLSWGESSLEVNGDPNRWEYTYDPEADVLTELESTPQGEVRRVYDFNADGSIGFTYYSQDEEGEWQEGAKGSVSADNIVLLTLGATITNTITIEERDDAGNPVLAERVTEGAHEAVTPLSWQIEYR